MRRKSKTCPWRMEIEAQHNFHVEIIILEDAEKSYEDFVKQTNASIKEKSKAIVNKSGEKAAKSEIDFSRSYEDKAFSKCNVELHQSCDSVMKNFKNRQNACVEERGSQAGQGDPVWCRFQ